MRLLYTVTLFLSSALLFLIQPMIAKMILPRFGGSPGVWNTSMVFFQAALLIGYGYAHLSIRWLGAKKQSAPHVILLILTILTLPIAVTGSMIWREGTGGSLEVLLVLALSVGLPFTVVSAGAPLIQRWFAATSDSMAKDPYFLYSASNIGSMLSLLAYPTLVEPNLTLQDQTRLWTYGFYLLVALMAACAVVLLRQRGPVIEIHESPPLMPAEETPHPHEVKPIDRNRRLKWIALAFCPSSLMLGVTTYLTTNIAPIPLLWIIPLALYLLTFIIAFARRQVISTRILGRVVPLLVIPLGLVMVLESTQFIFLLSAMHLLVFFLIAWMCHGELANDRPAPEHLTEFFFLVSVGGVLGGIFNALIAPLLFHTLLEYPLVIALACAFRPKLTEGSERSRWDLLYPAVIIVVSLAFMFGAKEFMEASKARTAIAIGLPLVFCFFATDRPIRFALSLAGVFAASAITQISVSGKIIEAHRSFYGLHRVVSGGEHGTVYHTLTNGNTIHGMENFVGPSIGEPLTYYYRRGPIGQVFTELGPTKKNIALVGLGVGSLAAYGRPGQRMTYYELDPDVIEIARDPKVFTFLANCKANLSIESGDARLTLEHADANSIDLLVLDAFSSDSIPVHLLTYEAFKMYLERLAPGGMIAVHISNRYLDLEPIVGKEAQALKLTARHQIDTVSDDDLNYGYSSSHWIVLTRSEADLGPLQKIVTWEELEVPEGTPLWTDDYSNLLGAFKHKGEDE